MNGTLGFFGRAGSFALLGRDPIWRVIVMLALLALIFAALLLLGMWMK